MPIRKPRRQTLQELAYPPVPKIGGVDLRADEKILGIEDWEIGDRSRRYPTTQALSLLSASDPGSRWGSSAGGSSVAGWPIASSTAGSQASSGLSSPQKSSVSFPTSATHHVKRKAPPSLDPTTASSTVSSNPSSSPSKPESPPKVDTSVTTTSASPPKRSFDGVVRPGDIVPSNWSPLTPAPSSAASRERRISQPAPPPSSYRSLDVPDSTVHTRSRSHSQTMMLAQSLPTIAASPRPTVEDVPATNIAPLVPHSAPASTSSPPKSTQAPISLPPTSPLRPIKKHSLQPTSPARPAGTQSILSSSVAPSRAPPAPSTVAPSSVGAPPSQISSSAPASSLLQVPQGSPYRHLPPTVSAVSAPASTVSVPNIGVGSQVSSSTQARSVSRALPRPPAAPASLPAAASLALSASRPIAASAPVSPTTAPQSAAIAAWRTGVSTSGAGGWIGSYGAHTETRPPPQTQPPPPPRPPVADESATSRAHYSAPPQAQYHPSTSPTHTRPPPTAYALLPASHNSGTMPKYGVGDYSSNVDANLDDSSPVSGAPTKLTRKLTKSKAPVSSPPTPRVIQSNGSALVSAQRALVGTHRPAEERIIWGLPLNRDPRVGEAVSKIEGMKDRLIMFGLEQFVQGRTRGAVMCNIDYRPPGYPNELAFDWITLKDAQKTLEPVLQKAIIQTDPATSVLVIVFLLSSSLNSLAIWRKCVSIPPGLLDRRQLHEVEKAKREIAATDRETVIKVCEGEELNANSEASAEAVFPDRNASLSRSGSTASRSRVLVKPRRQSSTPETPSPLRWDRSKSP